MKFFKATRYILWIVGWCLLTSQIRANLLVRQVDPQCAGQLTGGALSIHNLSKDPISVNMRGHHSDCAIRFDLKPGQTQTKNTPSHFNTNVGTCNPCCYGEADFWDGSKEWRHGVRLNAYVCPQQGSNPTLWVNNSQGGIWGIGTT